MSVWDRAAFFGRGVLAALAAAVGVGGCAGPLESPREPYAVPPAGAVGEAPAAGERGEWRVLETWRWVDAVSAAEPAGPVEHALERGRLGLVAARGFRAATGDACAECAASEAGLWWLRDEVVAVAKEPGAATVGLAGADEAAASPLPPLPVWLGAPHVLENARLSSDAKTLTAAGRRIPLALTPKIPTNASYVDGSTAQFFRDRRLRVRGVLRETGDGAQFVARTIWPQDTRLDAQSLALEPLEQNETLGALVQSQALALPEDFPVRLLYERNPDEPRRWNGKPVLAFVLSGAQGDDDGASGGHLAVADGVLGEDGGWSDWVVTNFYPLIDESAKGIVPAPVPMDNYLFDLNSGQLYYRPAYMLVAVLRRPRAATAVHAELQETMRSLYCREIDFERAGFNSTAMTIDRLREMGWRIPLAGPTTRVGAVVAGPIAALVEGSLETGRTVRTALSTELTRVLPRPAFEIAGHDLLTLAGSGGAQADLTAFERVLAEDVEAVLFVRLPQVPSSRRLGTYPVASLPALAARRLSDPTPYETAPETGTRELPPETPADCRAR